MIDYSLGTIFQNNNNKDYCEIIHHARDGLNNDELIVYVSNKNDAVYVLSKNIFLENFTFISC